MRGNRVVRGATPFLPLMLLLLSSMPAVGQVGSEPSVSLTLTQSAGSPVDGVEAGEMVNYHLVYAFSNGTFKNISIVLNLPTPVSYNFHAVPSAEPGEEAFAPSCEKVGGSQWTWKCTFTKSALTASGGAVTGEIIVTGYTQRWGIPSGALISATATLDGQYKDEAGDYYPLTQQNDEVSTRVFAAAVVNLNDDYYSPNLVNAAWEEHEYEGVVEPGLAFNYAFYAANDGSGRIDANSTFLFTLPDYAFYQGFAEVIPQDPPGSWSQTTASDHFVELNDAQYFGRMNNPPHGYYWITSHMGVRVWVPCSLLGRPAAAYKAALTFVGTETTAAGPVPRTATINLRPPSSIVGACYSGAGGVKDVNRSPRPPGDTSEWTITVTPPRGILQLSDPIMTDCLSPFMYPCAAPFDVPDGFTTYYCHVERLPGDTTNLTRAEVLSIYQTTACTTTFPADPTWVTDLVWMAEQWGDGGTITNLSFRFPLNTLVTTPPDTLILNVADMTTSDWDTAWGDPPSLSDTLSMSDTVGIYLSSHIASASGQYITGSAVVLGQHLRFAAQAWKNFDSRPPQNPRVELIVPPGAAVVDTPVLLFPCTLSGGKPAPGDVHGPVLTIEPDETKIYSWQIDNWTPPLQCNGCEGAWSNMFMDALVDFVVRADYPFLDNDALTPRLQVSSLDMPVPGSTSASVYVVVPDEQRVDVEPRCDAAGVNPVFHLNYANTGGGTLHDVEASFKIPRVGDGLGSTANATFINAETSNPGDATIWYATDPGGTNWSTDLPSPASSVTWVRVTVAELPPSAEEVLAITFSPGIDPDSSDVVVGQGTMRTTELGFISGQGAPFALNSCPCRLNVYVFLDVDGNGTFGAGDIALDGWEVNGYLGYDTSGTQIFSDLTDLAGSTSRYLSSGGYTLDVVVPTGTAASWVVQGGSTRIVTIAPASTVPVDEYFAVSCSCTSDSNECTDDICNADGSCTYLADDTNTCTGGGGSSACVSEPYCSSGTCVYANSEEGTWCDLCAACDGEGNCDVPLDDDDACANVDCDVLDTECTDYLYMTSGRCEGLGDCKELADCVPYAYSGTGTWCSLCAGCDGKGNCIVPLDDDIYCGNIDCNLLDQPCRDYAYLTSGRCEGLGDCKDVDAEDCTVYKDSGSGTYCDLCSACDGTGNCDLALADDKACGVIDCNVRDTACTDFVYMTSGRCEGLKDCKEVEDCVPYAYSGTGTWCGVCSGCDGKGNCNVALADDKACGEIDCNALDTLCTDYAYLTSGRCEGLGDCKEAPDDCVPYAYSGSGTWCGLCTGCDGKGSCGVGLVDDKACPIVDCSGLDTACAEYGDIATARCSGPGVCKTVDDCADPRLVAPGVPCDLCTGCDGLGGCNQMIADDDGCGDIDCTALNTACADYGYITSGRCRAVGECKTAPTDCTDASFADLGTYCELCSGCDGEGGCNVMLADDAACGVIDCSGLDEDCRTFRDLTSGRCQAAGVCHVPNGEACTDYTDAEVGTDCGLCQACGLGGTCSEVPADDDGCGLIACNGLDTVCRDYADLTFGRCKAFGECKQANTPSDCTVYVDAPITQTCGLCMACDGLGTCGHTPADDANCGTIDCDGLDVACRNYSDMTANRCKAFGTCRVANTEDCTDFVNATGQTSCGVCKLCDGGGLCANTPTDDANCGVVDCDALDTLCRDYLPVESARCEGFGDCKDSNTLADCTAYVNAAADAPCDDDTVCNGLERCSEDGICVQGQALYCDDAYDCTADGCDPDKGCYNVLADGYCIIAATCVTAGTHEGDEPCRECRPEASTSAWSNVIDGTRCSDGDLCTIRDACQEGRCVSVPVVCPEVDICHTPAECNPQTGRCESTFREGDVLMAVRMFDVGTLGGATSLMRDVNAGGVAVGESETVDGLTRAVRWSRVLGLVEMPVVLGAETRAYGINDAGLVVGTIREIGAGARAFVWTTTEGTVELGVVDEIAANPVVGPSEDGWVAYRNHAWSEDQGELLIPPLSGGTYARPTAVAVGGYVAGDADTGDGKLRAFRWDRIDGTVDLGSLGGTARAVAVNADGWVAGTSQLGSLKQRAFVWTPEDGMLNLGTLCTSGPDAVCGDESAAVGMDGMGRVTGWSTTAVGTVHAFLWTPGVGLEDLGALSEAGGSRALGINDLGQVAGVAERAQDDWAAFVWLPEVGMTDVGTLGGNPIDVMGIGPRGQLVGSSADAEGMLHGFVTVAPRTTCQLCLADDEPPELDCPAKVNLPSEAATCGASGAAVPWTMTDTCTSSDRLLVQGGAPEVLLPGTTEVTWVVTDEDGNIASCTSTVVVTDVTPPTVVCEPVILQDVEEGRCSWTSTLSAEVVDQCDGTSTITVQSREYPVGTTAVLFEAEDTAGNRGECTTAVTVVDRISPEVRCDVPALLTGDDLPALMSVTAYDLCTVAVEIRDARCLDLEADGTMREVTPCEVRVDGTRVVLSGASGDANRLTWTATGTDPSGNVTTVQCEVPLRDMVEPVAPAPVGDADASENVVCFGGQCAANAEVSLHGFGCSFGTTTVPNGLLPGLLLLVMGWLVVRVRRQERGE